MPWPAVRGAAALLVLAALPSCPPPPPWDGRSMGEGGTCSCSTTLGPGAGLWVLLLEAPGIDAVPAAATAAASILMNGAALLSSSSVGGLV